MPTFRIPDPTDMPAPVRTIAEQTETARLRWEDLNGKLKAKQQELRQAEATFDQQVRRAAVSGDDPPADPRPQLKSDVEILSTMVGESRRRVADLHHQLAQQLAQLHPDDLNIGLDGTRELADEYEDLIRQLEDVRDRYHRSLTVRRWLGSAVVPSRGVTSHMTRHVADYKPHSGAPAAIVWSDPAGKHQTDWSELIGALKHDASTLDTLAAGEHERWQRAVKFDMAAARNVETGRQREGVDTGRVMGSTVH